MEKILENYRHIKSQIAPYNPKIIAVTKYFDESQIIKYYEMGFRDFGENRVKDAIEKIEKLPDEIIQNSKFHLIGHLQTNKIKWAVGFFNLIHSVDSKKLASEISKKASELGVKQKILIQVNNSGEEQKYGIAPSQLEEMIDYISALKNIELLGLMNVAPLTNDEQTLRKLFSEMYKLKEAYNLKELSMGMSNDYKIALDCGATIVRLGRILFE